MKSIADLFGNMRQPLPKGKRTTERGELLLWISEKTGLAIKRVAFLTTGLKKPDLYFLKSDMEQAYKRGVPWGASFWHAVKPQMGVKERYKDFHRLVDKND